MSDENQREPLPYRSVFVTGASGYVGRQLIAALARERGSIERLVASDVRPPAGRDRLPGVEYIPADVRSADFGELFRLHRTDVVVHLAAIVTPGKGMTREIERAIDVGGTERVLEGCRAAGVAKLIYTSSGAAYGYHSDNPPAFREGDRLRGNPEFAYSDHKRLVEELLECWRSEHPQLQQLIFRVGTIFGAGVHNQISDLFDGRFVLGVGGASSPFVLIWDQDVVGAIVHGVRVGGCGIYNLAGDGTLSLEEMAARMGKPYLAVPPPLLRLGLGVLSAVGLSQYGPEQLDFLRYRPVLDNTALKRDFGYQPRRSTTEVFELFASQREHARPA